MINNISNIFPTTNIKPAKTAPKFRAVSSPNDRFQSTMNAETVTRKKFDSLFPNGAIDKIFAKINQDFGVENPAKLNFVYDETSQLGGGYTFNTNTIEMNLYDLMTYDKKLVGIKNGKKIPLVSPKEKLPLFVTDNIGKQIIDVQSKNGNLGFDKLIIEDVTPKEHQKFIIQKIAHECIHSKQHQILRETEGIDDKEIIKAWTHIKPKNLAEENVLNEKVDTIYQKSPWSQMPQPEIKYKKGSPVYEKAMILLDAIRNYPPVYSPEYTKNPLEREAFDVSALYVNQIMI